MAFEDELREALLSYRDAPDNTTWSVLSQVYIGGIQVYDALKAADPDFPDPYPLAAADIAGPDFLQWPVLPEFTKVFIAVSTICSNRSA